MKTLTAWVLCVVAFCASGCNSPRGDDVLTKKDWSDYCAKNSADIANLTTAVNGMTQEVKNMTTTMTSTMAKNNENLVNELRAAVASKPAEKVDPLADIKAKNALYKAFADCINDEVSGLEGLRAAVLRIGGGETARSLEAIKKDTLSKEDASVLLEELRKFHTDYVNAPKAKGVDDEVQRQILESLRCIQGQLEVIARGDKRSLLMPYGFDGIFGRIPYGIGGTVAPMPSPHPGS